MKITISSAVPADACLVIGNPDATHDHVKHTSEGAQLIIKADFQKKMSLRVSGALIHRVIQRAKDNHVRHLAIPLSDIGATDDSEQSAAAVAYLVENALIGTYAFNKYKTVPKEGFPTVDKLTFIGESQPSFKAAIARVTTIAEYVNASRDIANTRANEMTPSAFAQTIKNLFKGTKVTITIHDEKALKKMGAGAILAVGGGAKDKSLLITVEYAGGARGEKPLVLVGKGVMFDSGGLNLKPSGAMADMHLDMSGGTAVMHALALAARLKVKKNIVAVVPVVENVISNESYHEGDIIKSLSGKSIEILNTDAEGRVILSDALTYSKKYKPRAVVDVATLTGAAVIALGQYASALLSPDHEFAQAIERASDATGEPVWRLPLWEEAESHVKGTHGDVTNIDNKRSRWGGTINGATFLWQFAKELDCPWAHIDIAPRMEAAEHDYLAPGSTGEPVRLLLNLMETY